jgi:hypothetical protein
MIKYSDILASCDDAGVSNFTYLKYISEYINSSNNDEISHEILCLLSKRQFNEEFIPIINKIYRCIGLYPSIDDGTSDFSDKIIKQLYASPLNVNNHSIIFHKEQAQAFNILNAGNNLILSAPTSFGKSLLIDAIIKSRKPQNVIIIVPSIALLDETRKRMHEFSSHYKIITHPSQSEGEANIYILTQERAFLLDENKQFDLLVVDEFYKLSEPVVEKMDSRTKILNAVFYRLHKRSKQSFLLGPNIHELTDGVRGNVKFNFIFSRYSTVHINIHMVNQPHGKEQGLISLRAGVDGPMLIHCSSPKRAMDTAMLLASSRERGEQYSNVNKLDNIINWISECYHPEWSLITFLKARIGVHHASLPRALSQLMIQWFNEQLIDTIVCTSTIIEGVNTSAKHVAIYDSQINRKEIDYFTFSNIKGRSGRYLRHPQGFVWLFHEPPNETLPLVDFPIISQPPNTPIGVLMQIDKEDLKQTSQERVAPYTHNDIMDFSTLRNNLETEPEIQLSLAREINENIYIHHPLLNWNGYPNWEQLQHCCNLIWKYFVKRGSQGVFSAKQLAFRINKLRHFTGIVDEIREIIQFRPETTTDDALSSIFEFRRNWAGHKFPQLMMILCSIQKSTFSKKGMPHGDYSFYCNSVENLFLPNGITLLDEHGIPVEISRKILDGLNESNGFDDLVRTLKTAKNLSLYLTEFELEILNNSIKYL